MVNVTPPQTLILDGPADGSSTTSTTATFTFSATDDQTPPQFMEYECRLDTNDPDAWLECPVPASYSNLAPGQHTFQVRATDGFDNVDPTPATVTWTVLPPANCEEGNITLTAVEDTHVDESLPLDNFQNALALLVRSQAPGEDARAFVRFALPPAPAGCALQTATLRLFADGDAGRTLAGRPGRRRLVRVAADVEQPARQRPARRPRRPPARATASGTSPAQVAAMQGGAPNHGFVIRDAAEEDAEGAEQALVSSEAVNEPPVPPQLVLRYDDSGTPAPPAPHARRRPDGRRVR